MSTVSRTVSAIFSASNGVTLKSRLEVTQGHWKLYYFKAWVRFPISIQ